MITLDEAREALLRSGYLLESRVEALLRRRWYYVDANSVFPDLITGTTREIDVYGLITPWPIILGDGLLPTLNRLTYRSTIQS